MMKEEQMNVAVLGASNKPERYSYQAVKLLAEKGHLVFPVHPAISNGSDAPGTILAECSADFRYWYDRADIVMVLKASNACPDFDYKNKEKKKCAKKIAV